MTAILTGGHVNTLRDEGHVTIGAEVRLMQFQAKECQGLPAVTRSQEQAWMDSSSEPLERARPC